MIVCSSVLLLLMLFGVLRGVKLMLCFTKVMSPPPFCVVLSVLCVLYCDIVGGFVLVGQFCLLHCCCVYDFGLHDVCQFCEYFVYSIDVDLQNFEVLFVFLC